MLHKEIWGLTFLAFILWIFFLSANPNDRIKRVCAPVGWVGNVTVSLSALIVPSYQAGTQKWFHKFNYSCEYLVWRLFYQADYNAYMLKNGVQLDNPNALPVSNLEKK